MKEYGILYVNDIKETTIENKIEELKKEGWKLKGNLKNEVIYFTREV